MTPHHECLVSDTLAEMSQEDAARAFINLAQFNSSLTQAAEANARGIRVAPYWRRPADQLMSENADNYAAAGDRATALTFLAAADSWRLAEKCQEFESQFEDFPQDENE